MLRSMLIASGAIMLTSVLLLLWALLLLAPLDRALAWTLRDQIDATCSFINTGKIEHDVTVTVECAKALEQLAPLLEDLEEANNERADLSEELGAKEGIVQAALTILGEKNVPKEERATQLIESILSLTQTVDTLRSKATGNAPDLDDLRNAAANAIEAGELDKADDLLAELQEKEEDLKLEEQILAAASTKAERGQIDMSNLRYFDAAKHFDAAAEMVPRSSEEIYLDYLFLAATAYYREGIEFGKKKAAAESIKRFKKLSDSYSRDHVPLEWARAQNNFGIVLADFGHLGSSESFKERLLQAEAAYREALKERKRKLVPLDWAATQNNLGAVLNMLSRWESDTERTKRLKQAEAAYREALKERKRKLVPLDWARTQNNLGLALTSLAYYGSPGRFNETLLQAEAAYREALKERKRKLVPLDWAATQNNLGNMFQVLGSRASGDERKKWLLKAEAAYGEALEERTRQRVPPQWAVTQYKLGYTLWLLSASEGGTRRISYLLRAEAAYRAALEKSTRDRVPLRWADIQNDLGNTLRALGELDSGTDLLEQAVDAFDAALEIRTREQVQVSLDWAWTQNDRGYTLAFLGQRNKDVKQLEEAIQSCQNALEEFSRDDSAAIGRAYVQDSLGFAYAALAELTRNIDTLEKALEAYRQAIEIFKNLKLTHNANDTNIKMQNAEILQNSLINVETTR
ncbi:MAG: tetratricopeptide repeat protein [Geminicoccaceae bacterium]